MTGTSRETGSTSDEIVVEHEPDALRFTARVDESQDAAVLQYRWIGERALEYYRTFTPVPLRGRGIAGRLVRHALDYALESGYSVEPTCPFVARVIAEDPRYSDLTAA